MSASKLYMLTGQNSFPSFKVPGPPARIDVTERGSTHFEMTWDPPNEPNGLLVGYRISYQTSQTSFGVHTLDMHIIFFIGKPLTSSYWLKF